MKKIYKKLLLLSLCMGFTWGAKAQVALADVSSDKAYYIVSAGNRSVNSGGGMYNNNGMATYKAFDAADNNFYWMIFQYEGDYYLYNVGGSGYLNNEVAHSTQWKVSTIPSPLVVEKMTTNSEGTELVRIGPNVGTDDFRFAHVDGGLNIVTWEAGVTNVNSLFYIMEATEIDADVLANAVTEIGNIGAALGIADYKVEAANLLKLENMVGGYTPAQLANLKSVYDNGNVTDATALKSAIDAVKAETSRIAYDRNKAYTFITYGRSDAGWMMTGTQNGNVTAGNATTLDANYMWVVAEVEGKSYLYNVGINQYLVCPNKHSTAWTLSDSPCDLGMRLSDESNPAVYYVGAYDQMENRTSNDYFLHAGNSGVVLSWNAVSSTGASMWYLQVADIDDATVATALANAASKVLDGKRTQYLADAAAIYNSHAYNPSSTYIGYSTTDFTTEYQAAVSAINSATTLAAMEEAIDALEAATANATFTMPEAGKYYVIESAFTFDDGKTKYLYESYDENQQYVKWASVADDDARKLWQFTPNGTDFAISAVNTGHYMSAVRFGQEVYTSSVDDATAAPAYTITVKQGEGGTVELRSCWTNDDGSTDYATMTAYESSSIATSASTEGTRIMSWKDNSYPIFWKVREVSELTFTPDGLGYATRCYPVAVDLSLAKAAGLTVYAVSSVDEAAGKAMLTPFEDDVLAANTPVIFAYDPSADASYQLPISDAEGTKPAVNLLNGALTDEAKTAGENYVLMANADSTANVFGILSDDEGTNGGTIVPANRAYLPIGNAGTAAQTLSFDFGTPTGINGATIESDNDVVWYTLGGVRVDKPAKGIYVNSKGEVVLFK